ncbi:MAG TPA: TetR/AcrR family transcriptional regulator [Baekduia sp.]|uniref:TetR/AcrR family transcriptional regulator n=1 Tax=Baekduia sp. TaxID=2600305 RepID=UPI002CD386C4|nr:TetR/AcrR family transcriptional regulator [Baekduia sp.]HMJ37014.1 TetR/AcrR family transcriptional regulator [Baekduia sp.]
MASRAAGETRDRLLDAAARLLLRDPSKLTLDAVAEEAGTSKGGLLYHFPSKAQLLDAVVDRWEASFQDQIDAAADDTPGGWVRAYADVSALDGEDEHAREIDSGILAVLALQPERLEAVRARYERWQERIADDGIDAVDATVVRLAADGLWFSELMGLAPPRGELRTQVVERLRALTRDVR